MESLFDKQTAQKFIERINNLKADSPAQWGKMNVGQMVKHCLPSFKIASGELKIKVNPIVKFLFGNRARKQILQDPQFKRNLPTFAEAKVVDLHELNNEKKNLIAIIEKHQSGGSEKLTKEAHPFFGAMTNEEWDTLLVKHLDHHLRQFGV